MCRRRWRASCGARSRVASSSTPWFRCSCTTSDCRSRERCDTVRRVQLPCCVSRPAADTVCEVKLTRWQWEYKSHVESKVIPIGNLVETPYCPSCRPMTSFYYKKTAIQLALAALTMFGVSRQASAQAAEPATTTAAPAAPAAEEAPASRYPRGVIDRPLTLPAGLTMLGADFVANHDFSFIAAAPIIGYGITDDFEIQVPYQFALKEFEAKGLLSLELGYKILRGAAD